MAIAGTVSLFSGAGGLDIGLARGGVPISVSQEWDRDAVATLQANRKRVISGDIREIIRRDPQCKVFAGKSSFAVVGGPPCQSFSFAGKRLGLSDYRGRLFQSFMDVVKALHPRFLVLENVKGLASNSSALDAVLSRCKKAGFATVYAVLNSADFGSPQRRERLIILGSRDNEQIRLPVPSHINKWRSFGDAVQGLLDDGASASFSPRVRQLLSHIPEGGNWRDLPARLQREALGNVNEKSGGYCGVLRRLSFNRPAPTLMTTPTQHNTLLAHPTENRPLTVKEYARIQEFPDSWQFVGSISSRYKQIGNAVPIALGAAIGRALRAL